MSDLCQACGACCASFRVSFHWLEAPELPGALIEPLGLHRVAMRGTSCATPRCAALEGGVGEAVRCEVYAVRPPPCREVMPGDEKCVAARGRHGLPALAGDEWETVE